MHERNSLDSDDRATILVVDDHAPNVLALGATLARPDYEIVGAASGGEALKQILRREFAVVLLDVVMPVMDGFETARLIRGRPSSRDLPIIFLTANAHDVSDIYRAYEVGAVDYLVKPIDPDVVRAKVAVFVDLFRKARRIRQQEERLREVERRRGEEALQRSEELYIATFEEATIGIAHTDADGRFLKLNRRLCDILGMSASEALALHVRDITHPEPVGDEGLAPIGPPSPSEAPARRESRYVRTDGTVVWVDSTYSVIRDSDGSFRRGVLVVEDVSERRLAQERQQFLAVVSERLLSALDWDAALAMVARTAVPALADWCVVQTLGDGTAVPHVATAHSDPAKTEAVGELHRRLPVGAEHGVGKAMRTGAAELVTIASASTLVAGVSDPEMLALVETVGVASTMVVPLAARGLMLGTITLARATPSRRYSAADLAVAEDLAHRVAFALDNARLYREAQEAVSARDEFLSIASHELRTPLTPLQILLQRLLSDRGTERIEVAPPERLRVMLGRAERQVHRLTKLIDSLLDVSRISTGGLRLNREDTNLAELTRDVAGRFSEELSRAECRLALHLDPAVDGVWDRFRLEQVVTNLLSNAVKYGVGRPIDVTVSREAGTARLQIRDRGIGIGADEAKRIFGRFERAVSSRSYGGLGLGLYIARQIVEAHGGEIRVESQVGAGSEFTIDLPVSPTVGTSAPDAPDTRGPALRDDAV